MKSLSRYLIPSLAIVSITAVIAQSKYSGIYSGGSGQTKFLLAATNGGRILGLDNTSEGLSDALDPAKSTISADGKIKAVTPAGTIVSASVSSDYKISATVKSSEGTVRVSGKRIFK